MFRVSQSFAKQWDWPLQHQDGLVKVENTSDRFQVQLDNPYFTAKEVEVKSAKLFFTEASVSSNYDKSSRLTQ